MSIFSYRNTDLIKIVHNYLVLQGVGMWHLPNRHMIPNRKLRNAHAKKPVSIASAFEKKIMIKTCKCLICI